MVVASATSSMLQIETVDSTKGTRIASAAQAACTSARGASIPASPTGASTIGRPSSWPRTIVAGSRALTFRITIWRSFTASRSATFSRIVTSSYAPPST